MTQLDVAGRCGATSTASSLSAPAVNFAEALIPQLFDEIDRLTASVVITGASTVASAHEQHVGEFLSDLDRALTRIAFSAEAVFAQRDALRKKLGDLLAEVRYIGMNGELERVRRLIAGAIGLPSDTARRTP